MYLADGDAPFFHGIVVAYCERGIRRRQFFWSRLSKLGKKGNFVRSGYHLVQLLCFGVYFSPIFSRIGYHLQAKILEPSKTKFFVGTSPYKFRSSASLPPPGLIHSYFCPETSMISPIHRAYPSKTTLNVS